MKKIVLCGAGRYKEIIDHWAIILALEDNIVWNKDRADGLSQDENMKLDALHLAKIELADGIFVVDYENYVDKATMNEIQFALQKGKVVSYLSQDHPDWQPSFSWKSEPVEPILEETTVEERDYELFPLTLSEISSNLHQAAEAIDKLVGRK